MARATTIAEAARPDAPRDAAKLLEELVHASELMKDLAAAQGVLPDAYRRKADAMSRNMDTLLDTGRRRLSPRGA